MIKSINESRNWERRGGEREKRMKSIRDLGKQRKKEGTGKSIKKLGRNQKTRREDDGLSRNIG